MELFNLASIQAASSADRHGPAAGCLWRGWMIPAPGPSSQPTATIRLFWVSFPGLVLPGDRDRKCSLRVSPHNFTKLHEDRDRNLGPLLSTRDPLVTRPAQPCAIH